MPDLEVDEPFGAVDQAGALIERSEQFGDVRFGKTQAGH
jgi:hypothetical protein